MKNIRIFVFSSSLVLAVWLGASYMTEVHIVPNQDQNTTENSQTNHTTELTASEETEAEVSLPVAHIE